VSRKVINTSAPPTMNEVKSAMTNAIPKFIDSGDIDAMARAVYTLYMRRMKISPLKTCEFVGPCGWQGKL
jgi:hypothetical protein